MNRMKNPFERTASFLCSVFRRTPFLFFRLFSAEAMDGERHVRDNASEAFNSARNENNKYILLEEFNMKELEELQMLLG